MPSISFAYGLFDDDDLVGVVTFGSPASAPLCKGICGEEHRSKVIELNRLVLLRNKKNEASYLIANAIKLLPKPKVIVSYADSAQKHVGTVYQAANFLFIAMCTYMATRGRGGIYDEPTWQKAGELWSLVDRGDRDSED